MKLVVGLGNPGRKYQYTRHNLGFLALDAYLRTKGIRVDQERNHALCTSLEISRTKVWFLMPMLYMNRSGESLAPFAKKRFIQPLETLVLHDEADLEEERLQIKKGGGSGGHNGLESIFERWGTRDFYRLRIGIGREGRGEISDYLLESVGKKRLLPMVEIAAGALDKILMLGPEKAMNDVNVRST